jgi:2-dehydropantoate 2-reductase
MAPRARFPVAVVGPCALGSFFAQRLSKTVAKATAGDRSSMLQDVMAGRKSEIEHLTGALIRLARRHRLRVPTHMAFHQIIRIMEPR